MTQKEVDLLCVGDILWCDTCKCNKIIISINTEIQMKLYNLRTPSDGACLVTNLDLLDNCWHAPDKKNIYERLQTVLESGKC